MADHGHHVEGSMNITAQEKTFAGFIRLSIWASVIAILALIFMALANA